jgi:hypothetical protein
LVIASPTSAVTLMAGGADAPGAAAVAAVGAGAAAGSVRGASVTVRA